MNAFVFYVVAIIVIFTLVAVVADFSLWLQQRAEGNLEDSLPTEETES